MSGNSCDVCDQPWTVLFEWDYTSAERYCEAHILEPIDTQPGKTLLDFMPDCQRITHRLTVRRMILSQPVRYQSTEALRRALQLLGDDKDG
jgi:hypothetical protein